MKKIAIIDDDEQTRESAAIYVDDLGLEPIKIEGEALTKKQIGKPQHFTFPHFNYTPFSFYIFIGIAEDFIKNISFMLRVDVCFFIRSW